VLEEFLISVQQMLQVFGHLTTFRFSELMDISLKAHRGQLFKTSHHHQHGVVLMV
jgi:hypothetical protein